MRERGSPDGTIVPDHNAAAKTVDRTAELPVIGIDGCRGGWVTVELREPDHVVAEHVTDLQPVVDRLRAGRLGAVAIDIPIGLLDAQPRDCDVAARRVLGPRRSSVFPAPVRDTLDAVDYQDACRRSRDCSGKALSVQAFNLIPKITEVDRLVEPSDQDRLVEAHPECAFARLLGRPLDAAKRTAAGAAAREQLLRGWNPALGAVIDSPHGLPPIDLLDAAALVVTAGHVVAGTAHRLGSQRDRRGLLAQITY
ncbi:MAG: DUF429 domain-containing protein [Actinomycetota bacterium]